MLSSVNLEAKGTSWREYQTRFKLFCTPLCSTSVLKLSLTRTFRRIDGFFLSKCLIATAGWQDALIRGARS